MTGLISTEEILLRLALAVVLGGLVGLDRERMEWAAGLRTHMIVCLGSALAMIVSAYGLHDVVDSNRVILDPSRIASQVLGGIGFICAGTILQWRHEVIRGLTTAASLWVVAAIGLASGAGLYQAAVGATACALIILIVFKSLERRLFGRPRMPQLRLIVDRDRLVISELKEAIATVHTDPVGLTVTREQATRMDTMVIDLPARLSMDKQMVLIARLQCLDGIASISLSDDAGKASHQRGQ